MLQCQSYALFSFAFVSNGFFKILSLCILGLFKKSFQIDIKQESQLNCIIQTDYVSFSVLFEICV